MFNTKLIKQYGVPLSAALTHGKFVDALGRRETAKANAELNEAKATAKKSKKKIDKDYHKEMIHCRIRHVWRAHWESIIRRQALNVEHKSRIFLYAQPTLNAPYVQYIEAALERASVLPEEYNDIRFEDGVTIYNVRIMDKEATNLAKSSAKKESKKPSKKAEAIAKEIEKYSIIPSRVTKDMPHKFNATEKTIRKGIKIAEENRAKK